MCIYVSVVKHIGGLAVAIQTVLYEDYYCYKIDFQRWAEKTYNFSLMLYFLN